MIAIFLISVISHFISAPDFSEVILNSVVEAKESPVMHGKKIPYPAEQDDKGNNQVEKLPVVVTGAKIRKNEAPAAFMLSGDGGWFGFEQSVADRLAELGIPVVGLDSRKYFWNRTTPEATAKDIEKLLNYYGKKWNKKKFVLIGYSLGAEIVPFIYNRLTPQMKSEIKSIALLSPETNTDFEIHISNMLGLGNKQNTYNVIDEIARIRGVPTLVIFGEGEKSVVPNLLKDLPVEIRKIPGDHHYKSDERLIVKTLMETKII